MGTTSCLGRHWITHITTWLRLETAEEQLLWRALGGSSVDWGCPIVMLWRLTVCTGLGTVSVLEVWISNTACDTFFHELSKLQPDLEAMRFVLVFHAFSSPRLTIPVHLASVCSKRWCSLPWEKGVVTNPQPDDINSMLKCIKFLFLLPNTSRWNWSS